MQRKTIEYFKFPSCPSVSKVTNEFSNSFQNRSGNEYLAWTAWCCQILCRRRHRTRISNISAECSVPLLEPGSCVQTTYEVPTGWEVREAKLIFVWVGAGWNSGDWIKIEPRPHLCHLGREVHEDKSDTLDHLISILLRCGLEDVYRGLSKNL